MKSIKLLGIAVLLASCAHYAPVLAQENPVSTKQQLEEVQAATGQTAPSPAPKVKKRVVSDPIAGTLDYKQVEYRFSIAVKPGILAGTTWLLTAEVGPGMDRSDDYSDEGLKRPREYDHLLFHTDRNPWEHPLEVEGFNRSSKLWGNHAEIHQREDSISFHIVAEGFDTNGKLIRKEPRIYECKSIDQTHLLCKVDDLTKEPERRTNRPFYYLGYTRIK